MAFFNLKDSSSLVNYLTSFFVVFGTISGGFLAARIKSVGDFSLGALFGLNLSMFVLNAISLFLYFSEKKIPILAVLIIVSSFVLMGGLTSVAFNRKYLIIYTSFIGSFYITCAGDVILGSGYAGKIKSVLFYFLKQPSNERITLFSSYITYQSVYVCIPIALNIIIFGVGIYVQNRKLGDINRGYSGSAFSETTKTEDINGNKIKPIL